MSTAQGRKVQVKRFRPRKTDEDSLAAALEKSVAAAKKGRAA
jgi:hypothetical protein